MNKKFKRCIAFILFVCILIPFCLKSSIIAYAKIKKEYKLDGFNTSVFISNTKELNTEITIGSSNGYIESNIMDKVLSEITNLENEQERYQIAIGYLALNIKSLAQYIERFNTKVAASKNNASKVYSEDMKNGGFFSSSSRPMFYNPSTNKGKVIFSTRDSYKNALTYWTGESDKWGFDDIDRIPDIIKDRDASIIAMFYCLGEFKKNGGSLSSHEGQVLIDIANSAIDNKWNLSQEVVKDLESRTKMLDYTTAMVITTPYRVENIASSFGVSFHQEPVTIKLLQDWLNTAIEAENKEDTSDSSDETITDEFNKNATADNNKINFKVDSTYDRIKTIAYLLTSDNIETDLLPFMSAGYKLTSDNVNKIINAAIKGDGGQTGVTEIFTKVLKDIWSTSADKVRFNEIPKGSLDTALSNVNSENIGVARFLYAVLTAPTLDGFKVNDPGNTTAFLSTEEKLSILAIITQTGAKFEYGSENGLKLNGDISSFDLSGKLEQSASETETDGILLIPAYLLMYVGNQSNDKESMTNWKKIWNVDWKEMKPPYLHPRETKMSGLFTASKDKFTNYMKFKSLVADKSNQVQSMLTNTYRMQYFYAKMQSSAYSSSTDELNLRNDTLSSSFKSSLGNSTSQYISFSNYIPHVKGIRDTEEDLQNIVINDPEAFICWINTMNEWIYISNVLPSKIEPGKFATIEKTSTDFVDNILILRQLKAAITFIEGLPSDINLSEFTAEWYKKRTWADNKNMSYEEVYNLAQDLEIDNLELNDNLVADGKEETNPIEYLFTLDGGKVDKINKNLLTGIRFSSTFVPMQTNIYDPATWTLLNDDEFYEFHYKWGYNRKALYIDKNGDAASDWYVTRKQGETRVATLQDVLSCEKDIVLYIDDNFYNADQLAEMQDKVFDRLDNVDTESRKSAGGLFASVSRWFKDLFTIDILETVKTAEKTQYNVSLKRGCDDFADTYSEEWKPKSSKNGAVLAGPEIKEYLGYGDENDTDSIMIEGYSYMQPFALVSAIYRDGSGEYFNFINKKLHEKQSPVFISSKNVALQPNSGNEETRSLINYTILKNMQDDLITNYTTNVDLESPIYMDVYGNIVTESGRVIIPVASNATLNIGDTNNSYNIYNAGWLHTYGNTWYIPDTYKDIKIDKLILDEDNRKWVMQDAVINSKVSLNRLSIANDSTLETLYALYSRQFQSKWRSNFDLDSYVVWIMMEVMRGAPLENIRKDFEGLNPVRLKTKHVGTAIALEKLTDAISNSKSNSLLKMPEVHNSAVMSYVTLFIYKVGMIVIILMLMIQIFVNGLRSEFRMVTILKLIGSIGLTIGVVYVVPKLYDLSQYTSNKLLLQGETEYMSMLNLEKQEAGVELTMTDILDPELNTDLYITLDKLDIKWYSLVYKILVAPLGDSITDVYADARDENLATDIDEFDIYNDEIRISLNNLFSSSDVILDQEYHYIYQNFNNNCDSSHYLPYYMFVDKIVAYINDFNYKNDTYSYTTQIYAGGKIKSIGLMKQFYTSDEFANDNTTDYWGIYDLYGIANDIDQSVASSDLTADDIEEDLRKYTAWYNDNLTEDEIKVRAEMMNDEGKKWIAANRALMGKISDETIIKSFALHMSLYYNKIFGVNSAREIEIANLDMNDLVKLSIASKDKVLINSPMSFSRFVFHVGGEVATILAAILQVVLMIASFVRPISTLVVFVSIYLSIFIYRLILRKNSNNVRGLIKLMLLICSLNLFYAILIKISILLPSILKSPSLCMLVQILLHGIFAFLFMYVALLSIRNWQDLGNTILSQGFQGFKDSIFHNVTFENIRQNKTEVHNRAKEDVGWALYESMKKSDDKKGRYKNKEKDSL